MKIVSLLIVFAVLLCGCQNVSTFEVLEDVYYEQERAAPKEIVLSLSDSTTLIRNGNSRLYLCDGFDVTVETMYAGNVEQTMQTLTGFAPDALTMVQTSSHQMQRYECAWSSAGEGGVQVGRAVVLDDGSYHYCVTVTALAEQAGALYETWNTLLDSIVLR